MITRFKVLFWKREFLILAALVLVLFGLHVLTTQAACPDAPCNLIPSVGTMTTTGGYLTSSTNVTLNGGNDPVAYWLDCGNGEGGDWSGFDYNTTVTFNNLGCGYSSPGPYTVTVGVMDDDGDDDYKSKNVTVTGPAPGCISNGLQCGNCVDDDGDGTRDFPPGVSGYPVDAGCNAANDDWEGPTTPYFDAIVTTNVDPSGPNADWMLNAVVGPRYKGGAYPLGFSYLAGPYVQGGTTKWDWKTHEPYNGQGSVTTNPINIPAGWTVETIQPWHNNTQNYSGRSSDSPLLWEFSYGTPTPTPPPPSPPTGTITPMTCPRNTVLGSGATPGTITGTVSGGSGSYLGVQMVIRRGDGSVGNDWTGASWFSGYTITAPSPTLVGNNWTLTGAGVPPIGQMTNGQTYRVYLNVIDSLGATNNWNVFTPLCLFDNMPPTCTVTAYPNPTTGTRLTSSGSPSGTIAGNCQDPVPPQTSPISGSATRASYVNRYLGVLREWNGISPPYNPVCGSGNYRDWNGSWLAVCAATNFDTSVAAAQSVNWSTTNTPTTAQMTALRYYMQYAESVDAAGNVGTWVAAPLTQYAPNVAPVTSNVKSTEPDYCTAINVPSSVTASWTYSDPPPSTGQSAYQVQIHAGPPFLGSPVFDSGKLLGSTLSYPVPSGLTWGTTYRIRVQTWDGGDLPSGWTNQTLCTGPGCIGGASWLSPAHAYPDNTETFTWLPPKPIADEPVQFDDGSTLCLIATGVPIPCIYLWKFGDGATSTEQNPLHTYATNGAFDVNLQATDNNGYSCNTTKSVNIQKPVPKWREILPW